MSATEEGVNPDILDSESAAAKQARAELAPEEPPKELECIPVPGSPRECTFVLRGEDHTLGNTLRCMLMHNPRVHFAGYSVPHPLTREIHVRVVAATDEVSPAECLVQGLRDLSASAEALLRQFDAACTDFAAAAGGDVKTESKAAF